MKKILLVFLCFISLFPVCHAQNSSIDSLLSDLSRLTVEDTLKAKLLYTLSRAFISNSEYSKAGKYAIEGLALAEKLKYENGIVKSHSCIAYLKRNEGKYEESLEHEFAALKIIEKTGPYSDKATVYNNIGISFKNLGKLDDALKYHLLSLSIKKRLGDDQGIANSHNNIGLIYMNKHDYLKSFEHLFEALKWGEKTGNNKFLSDYYNNIGLLYKHQENYSKALEYYNKSLEFQLENGNKNGTAFTYINIGVANKHLGHYKDAINNFMESLKIFEKTKNQKVGALAYNNLGNIYKNMVEDELEKSDSAAAAIYRSQAEHYYLLAVNILEETKNWKGLAGVLSNLGILSHINMNFPLASEYFDKAMLLCEQYQFKDVMRDVTYNRSRLDSSLASQETANSGEKGLHWFNAYLNYKRYSNLQDSLINEEIKEQISEIQTKYETEKKDEEIKLLKAENDIQELQILKNQSWLKASLLEKKQKENELLLLQKSNVIDGLDLIRVRQELEQAKYKSSIAQSNLVLIEKDRSLKKQQLENQNILRNSLIAGIALLIISSSLAFSRFKLRKKLEQQMAVETERQRISADLHDDIGSGLSKISLLSHILVSHANTPEAEEEAAKIALASKSLIENINEIVWSLSTSFVTIEDFISFIRRYAAEYFEIGNITVSCNVPKIVPNLTMSAYARRNVFYSVKEALHNIVKHSEASEVTMKFNISDSKLKITIFDNGKGFNIEQISFQGNGLANMKKRMAMVNGAFHIENHVGTTIIFQVPLAHTPQG